MSSQGFAIETRLGYNNVVMNYRVFLILIVLGTVISGVSWLAVIFNFDPGQIGPLGFLLFYASLFLSLSGLFFLAADFGAIKFNPRQLAYARVGAAWRHALLFAVLIIGWAILKSNSLLRWWNLLLLIAILTIIEFFYISTDKQRAREKSIHYEPLANGAPAAEGDNSEIESSNY